MAISKCVQNAEIFRWRISRLGNLSYFRRVKLFFSRCDLLMGSQLQWQRRDQYPPLT